MSRVWPFAAVLAVLLQVGTAPTIAQSDGPLKYLNSSFVTGDAVVGGVSLFRKGAANGFASQNIRITGVPPEAEILSAYLYIQTTVRESQGEDAGIAGAQFKGHSLNTTVGPLASRGPIAKPLNWAERTEACWSYGWNPRRRLVTYRADVLRFLSVGSNGKHIANGDHLVRVADAGRVGIGSDDAEDGPAMTGPRAVGASLVLIYRDPNPEAPLRSIVIYDGGATKRSFETFTQRIQGFYQAATVAPDAKMTHIVGDGQALFSERVQFGAQTYAANPYIGRLGPRWDNPTFSLGTALKPYPDASNQNRVTVQSNGLLSDCLSWSAIVVSTKVQDTDADGLLDIWESSTSEIKDPTGQALPRLQQMGADPAHQDLFVEVGYLKTDGPVTYGGTSKPAHSHLPSLDALKQVATAFQDAPVLNPNNVRGISVHFDVGPNHYQTDPTDPIAPNAVPSYIVPASLARGGRNISETACANASGAPVACPPGPALGQYPAYPGTVGWKTGFRFYRDDVFKFSRARKDIFRYVLFAHALGIPKEENEFLPGTTTDNPAFHIPRTNSGVADWAGADALVTLGAFDDSSGRPVGTPFMQASTLMHEWGHNFKRRHGGDLFEPNCKPQYLSVMNYLYQLRGLLDANAVPRLDYNRVDPDPNLTLDETGVAEAAFDNLRYRMGWYAPKATSYLRNQVGGAATKHCDGSPLPSPDPNPLMVRVDATGSLSDPIDWNADTTPGGAGPQDLNFDGLLTTLTPGSDDWSQLRLNQLGSRRSIGGVFLDKNSPTVPIPIVGPMSLNAGKGDLGKGDLGKGDLGKGDLGKGDLGKGDLGKGDLGKGDLGKGDLGKGDLGKGDLGGGDLDVGSGIPGSADQSQALELDFETAVAATGGNPTPPSAVQVCLTNGEGQCASTGGDRPVRLDWLAPNVGAVVEYFVYRFVVTSLDPFDPPTEIAAADLIAQGITATTYLDSAAPAGANLAYVVVARFTDGRVSGISNFATVRTPGTPMAAAVVIADESSIFDGTPKPVTVTTTPAGLAVSVTYGPNATAPGSLTPPSAYGAYFVRATVTEPGYTGTASIVKTIATTLRIGGTGGDAANSFCGPGVFATGLRASTNSYYGLLGYQVLCADGNHPPRVAGPLNPSYGHTAYAEATAACGAGEVMVGVHGTTGAPFGFTVVQTIGPRCEPIGGGSRYDVGAIGGGASQTTPFSLTCEAGFAAGAAVGGVGEVADGVALVCPALPAVPTITSASPASPAPGQGFLVVRGTGLPAVAGSAVVFTSGVTGAVENGFILVAPSTPAAYYVRLPPSFPIGAATVRVQNGATTTNAFPITVASTPGTPVITNVYTSSAVVTTQVESGQTILVAADGIDTLGAGVRFQQGAVIQDVAVSSTVSNPTVGLASQATAPVLIPGTVQVSIRQGGSAFSAPVTLTVPPGSGG